MNQRFTGQERDTETGLDFFQARYMSAGMGRFMSPDPANAGADFTNPQSWNAYAYVLGNPLEFTDPTGLHWEKGPPVTQCYCTGGSFEGQSWLSPTHCDVQYTQVWVTDPTGPSQITGGGGGGGGSTGGGGLQAPPQPPKTGSQILPCFVKGVQHGAVGALLVAGGTALAATVLAPEVITGALLVGAGYGLVQTGLSVSNNLQRGNQAGLAYDAGSVFGGLLGGGSTGFGVRYSITRETNLPTSIGDFFGKGKGIDFNRPGQNAFQALRTAFSKGPDLAGASLAVALGADATTPGCGN